MVVPMTPFAIMPDVNGRRYRCFVPFNFLLSLAAPHLYGLLVFVTSNKFIASVVSGNNCSPVSTTPAITENPWQIKAGVIDTLEQFIASVIYTVEKHSFDIISEKVWRIRNGPNGILGGPGDTDSWNKPEVKNIVSDSL